MKQYILSLFLISLLVCSGCTITNEMNSEPEKGAITGGTIIPNTTALLRVPLSDDSQLPINTVLKLYNSVNTSEVFAVTTVDSGGAFAFTDVPFGSYDIVSTTENLGALFQNITLSISAPEYHVDSLAFYRLVSMYIYTGDREIESIAYYSEALEKDSTEQYVFDAIEFPSSRSNSSVQNLDVQEATSDSVINYSITISADSSYINVYRVGDKTVFVDTVYQDSLFNDSLFLDSLYGDTIVYDTSVVTQENSVLVKMSQVLVGNYNKNHGGSPLLFQSVTDAAYNDLELLYENEQSFRTMINEYGLSLEEDRITSIFELSYPGTDTLAMMSDPGVVFLMDELGMRADSVYVDNIELMGYDGNITVYFVSPERVFFEVLRARYDSLKGSADSHVSMVVTLLERSPDDHIAMQLTDTRVYQFEKTIRTGTESCEFGFGDGSECTITKQYWEFVIEPGDDTYQKYELGTSPCLLGKLDTACTRGLDNIEFYAVAETFSSTQYIGYNQFSMQYDGWDYAGQPFLTFDDIVSYDSSNATFEITSEASARVPDDVFNMFVVAVDGVPAFWGVHWSPILSSSTDAVVMSPLNSEKTLFKLEFGYPQDIGHYMSPLKSGEFLRRLEEGGKLK